MPESFVIFTLANVLSFKAKHNNNCHNYDMNLKINNYHPGKHVGGSKTTQNKIFIWAMK